MLRKPATGQSGKIAASESRTSRNRLMRVGIPPVADPYRDWYQVYRIEVVDRIKHWPSNRKNEMEEGSNMNPFEEGVRI